MRLRKKLIKKRERKNESIGLTHQTRGLGHETRREQPNKKKIQC
jgi:hypothetical protein